MCAVSDVRRFKLRHLGMSGVADAMELWVAPEEDFPSGRETPIVLASDHDRIVAEMQKQIDELKENHRKDEDVWIARIERLQTALRFYADENNWMVTRKDELHEARRTIIGDVDSYGYQHDERSPNILQIIAGKTAREALEVEK